MTLLARRSRSTGSRFALVSVVALCATALLGAEKATKSAKAGKGPARWEETIRKFESADVVNPPPKGAVLLVGGSNARRWTDVGSYFPQHRVINRGFGGAQLADVLHFTDRIVLPYAPKTILLNAGGNDLAAGASPEEVRDACRAFVVKVHARLPDTRILCLSLPPVMRGVESPEVMAAIKKMNTLLAGVAREERSVEFIDLFSPFLGADGKPRPELFVEDGTHFSPQGYAIVAGLIREKL